MKYKFIKKFIVLLLFILPTKFYGEENIDKFVLPETVPSIERLSMPKIDQPVLKKQKFISESVITPSHSLQEPNFSSFIFEHYLIDVELYSGSFSSLGGNLAFSSSKEWEINYETYHSNGEKSNLASDNNNLKFQIEKFITGDLQGFGKINIKENTLWNQSKDNHLVETGLTYYLSNTLNVKSSVIFERTEIKELETNEFWDGNLSLKWQPLFGHDLKILYSFQRDTSFSNYDDFSSFDIKYNFKVRTGIILGGGLKYYDKNIYPLTNVIWHFLSRLRLDLYYKQDIEKPRWANLYSGDKYVTTFPDLLWPESKFSMGEKLSYYWGENGLAEVEFFQSNLDNFIHWQYVPGTNFITLANMDNVYISGYKTCFSYSGETLSPKIEFTQNFNSNIPFISSYKFETVLDYFWYSWTLGLGYEYVSDRYFSLTDNNKLDAYTNLSVSVKKYISSELEMFVRAQNVLSEKIEVQPEFIHETIDFQGGVVLYF